MPEWTGTVVATSEFGIKVVDKGEWLNWSLADYRGKPFDTNIRQGDRVRIEYAKGKGDKTYISVIENLSRPQESDAPGSVFPPEQDFPPDEVPYEYPPPDTTSEPSESPTDRQTSIVRQTCIKAAAMALQHGMGTPEEKAGGMTYLAGALEDWVNR
jgi:hypothetical protein